MLEVRELRVSYSDIVAVSEANLFVGEGEVVSLVGSNGAGKTTTLKTISGLLKPNQGEIIYGEHHLEKLTAEKIVKLGIVHVPEGRGIFPRMSVEENLLLGAFIPSARKKCIESVDKVFSLFPKLKERKRQLAGTLSGGEQQMLAIGRGLMTIPGLLMLDEPSLGLAPLMVQQVFEVIMEIAYAKTTILLVEQNVHLALNISQRGYVMENGDVVLSGTGKELLEKEEVKKAYLGLG